MARGGWGLVAITSSQASPAIDWSNGVAGSPTNANYVKPLRNTAGSAAMFDCGTSVDGVVGEVVLSGSWSWSGTYLEASAFSLDSFAGTWAPKLPGYVGSGSGWEADSAWSNGDAGVHLVNFGFTGFGEVDGRVGATPAFACDPNSSAAGTSTFTWFSGASGDRFIRYWLKSGCDAGYYDPEDGSECRECGPGSYRSDVLSDASECVLCAAGTYGSSTGETSASCEGQCAVGHFCEVGATSMTDQQCPAGTYGGSKGLTDAGCSGLCEEGHYCEAGSTSATATPCPAGSYGAAGAHTSACSGLCGPGYYCPAGSTVATQNECGSVNVYCPTGSGASTQVDAGYYTRGPTTTTAYAQVLCERGHYCVGGERFQCPVGRFGSSEGLSTASCSGGCQPGYYCPAGSVSGTQEVCGDVALYCPAGATARLTVSDGYYSTPESGNVLMRSGQASCAEGETCSAGVRTTTLAWSGCPAAGAVFAVDENVDGDAVGAGVLTASNSNDGGDTFTYTISDISVEGDGYEVGVDPGFSLVTSSESVTDIVTDGSLNYEASYGSAYTLTIKAKSANTGGSTYCAVYVLVTDKNDEPTLTNTDVLRQISEALTVGSDVGAPLIIADEDAGQEHTLSIASGGDNDLGGGAVVFTLGCSGQLRLATSTLDFETLAQYTLLVTVEDNGTGERAPAMDNTYTVVVDITDDNDAPVFGSATVAPLVENAAAGTLVVSFPATDPEGATVFYDLHNAVVGFEVTDPTVAEVRTTRPLDYEVDGNAFTLVLSASDGDRETYLTVEVALANANDEPVVRSGTYYVSEAASNGDVVGRATRSDQDTSDEVTWYLVSGNTDNTFSLDERSGTISVADGSSLDYEGGTPSFSLAVVALDGSTVAVDSCADMISVNGWSAEAMAARGDADVCANDEDVGGSCPAAGDFAAAEAVCAGLGARLCTAAELSAGEATGASCGLDLQAVWTSTSCGLNMYYTQGASPICSLTACKRTCADASAGSAKAMCCAGTDARVAETAAEQYARLAYATTALPVLLLNVNEPPVFNDQVFEVDENTAIGTAIGAPVVVSDPDQGQSFYFSFVSGNEAGKIAIGQLTGQLSVAGDLDFEDEESYPLLVRVTDNGNPGESVDAMITVDLRNVNEAPNSEAIALSLQENSVGGTLVGSCAVTDVDAGDTAALTYTLTSGDPAGFFTLAADDAALTVSAGAELNFEETPSIALTVTAQDPAGLTSDSIVTLTLGDVNEAPVPMPDGFDPATSPAAQYGDIVRAVGEGTLTGSALGDPVVCYDYDAGSGAPTFVLDSQSPANSIFTMDGSGQISTTDTVPTAASQGSYELSFTCFDATDGGLSNSGVAIVNVASGNEPPAASPQSVSIEENVAFGTTVATAATTDPDGDALSYSFARGNDALVFRISASSGVITVARALLNFEDPAYDSFVLTVRARDDNAVSMYRDYDIIITVSDVEEAPVPTASLYEVTVDENAADGDLIGVPVVAIDPDVGSSISYQVMSGDSNGLFTIDEATAQLAVRAGAVLNYEELAGYFLVVRATDNTGLYAEYDVRVNLNNINDLPTITSVTLNIPENSPTGTQLSGGLNGADEDYQQAFTYSVGPAPGFTGVLPFKISDDQLYIEVTDGSLLNYEDDDMNLYELIVTVTDDAGGASSASVYVRVTDLNDAPTIDNLDQMTQQVVESSGAGFLVLDVAASDEDEGETELLTYAITSGNSAGLFAIAASTGAVTVKSTGTLDFETLPNFSLRLRVTDVDGAFATATLRILLMDVNERPVLSDKTVSLDENSAVGTSAYAATHWATDVDDSQRLEFAIQSVTPSSAAAYFRLDDRSTTSAWGYVLAVAQDAFNYEEDTRFEVQVSVTDSGSWDKVTVAGVPASAATYVFAGDSDAGVITSVEGFEATITGSATITASPPLYLASSSYVTMADVPAVLAGAVGVTLELWCSFVGGVATPTLLEITGGASTSTVLITGNLDTSDLVVTIAAPGLTPFTLTAYADDDILDAGVLQVAVTIDATDATLFVNGNVHESVPHGDGSNIVDSFNAAASTCVLGASMTADVYALTAWTVALSSSELAARFDAVSSDTTREPLSHTATITVNMLDVNEVPETADVARSVEENSAVNVFVGDPIPGTDVDEDTVLTFTLDNDPSDAVGLFKINPCTGQIQVAVAQLDHEAKESYTLTVTVTDDGVYHEQLFVQSTVTVTIVDVNEAPTLSVQPVNVVENTPLSTDINVVYAVNDVDEGDVAQLSFAIIDGNSAGKFSINPATAAVTVSGELDYEFLNSYTLTLEVSDNDAIEPLLATTTLQITVLDENERPEYTSGSKSVKENNLAGGVVGVSGFTCFDVDGDTLSYAIVDSGSPTGDDKLFAINAATAVVTVIDANTMNYEVKDQYVFEVTATDPSGLSDTATLTVNVLNVNEQPAIVTATLSIAENSGSGVKVATVAVLDEDFNDPPTFSITTQSSGGAFSIGSYSGDIEVDTVSLNYEDINVYTVTVKATDAGGTGLSDTQTFTINVGNLNESPGLEDYSANIDENSGVGVGFNAEAVYTATDVDEGNAAFGTPTHVYSITAGNTGGVFQIDSRGYITVATATLNYEVQQQFVLSVLVKDLNGAASALSDTATVTINVNDVNEQPVFSSTSMSANVPENFVNGTMIARLGVTDPDDGDTMTFSIIAGAEGQTFYVVNSADDPLLADLYLNTTLNQADQPVYNLDVQVTDAAGLSSVGTVVVTVIDANWPPECNAQVFNVDEMSGVGTSVGTVLATDPDVGQQLSYEIYNWVDTNAFRIDRNSGQIKVNRDVLNFETTALAGPVYTLRVIVQDDSSSGVLEDDCTITININDVNDQPIMVAYTVDVDENSAVDTLIGSPVTGTDPDGDSLRYSITGGNTGWPFKITQGGAQLMVNNAILNYEQLNQYVLTVKVTDTGAPALSHTAQVTVNINDVNDSPTVSAFSQVIAENSGSGALIGTVLGDDVDFGQSLAYTIHPTDDDGSFTIDAATGDIFVGSVVLDYEVTASYTIEVVVTDDGSATAGWQDLFVSTQAQIAVGDLNESPVITAQFRAVDENSVVGTPVGAPIPYFDQDLAGTEAVTFSMTGDNEGTFIIDEVTGQIKIASVVKLNHELRQQEDGSYADYQLTVTVTDKGGGAGGAGRSASALVTITVNDVNEAPVMPDYQLTVDENMPAGTLVGAAVVGSDVDFGDTAALVYTIQASDAPAGWFQMDPSSGQITTTASAALNFEDVLNMFALTVRATDPDGAFDEGSVTITLIDVNEQPLFSSTDYFFTVDENTRIHTSVGESTEATDVDELQTLRFSIEDARMGTADLPFKIDLCSGQVRVALSNVLNFEGTKTYDFQIMVLDDGNYYGQLSDTAMVHVAVMDINEAPTFTSPLFEMNVQENWTGEISGSITASDVDEGQTAEHLVFAITGGNAAGHFSVHDAVNAYSAYLTLDSELNFEDVAEYTLQIMVTDTGIPNLPALSSTSTVVITVSDVNEYPDFIGGTVTVDENSAANTLVLPKLAATDVDQAQTLTFTMTPSDYVDITTDGQMFTFGDVFDYEVTPNTTVTVTVSDNGSPPLSTEAEVLVLVGNVNETPTFNSMAVDVVENTPKDTVIKELDGTDPDVEDLLYYTIIGGSGINRFGVKYSGDGRTAWLIVAQEPGTSFLNYEAVQQYDLVIECSDREAASEGITVSATVAITVLDTNEPPYLPDGAFVTVDENTAAGYLPGFYDYDLNMGTDFPTAYSLEEFTAIDPDGDIYIFYEMQEGYDSEAFDSVLASSGSARIKTSEFYNLDYETKKEFTVQVFVYDQSQLGAYSLLTVYVNDLNDPPYIWTNNSITVGEGSPTGATVGVPIGATDEDGDAITFELVDNENTTDITSTFELHGTTGQLTIKNNNTGLLTVPGSEDFKEITVPVTVYDEFGLSDTKELTVTVVSNNIAPELSRTRYELTVAENSAGGTIFGPEFTQAAYRFVDYFYDFNDDDVGLFTFTLASIGTADALTLFDVDVLTGEIFVREGATVDYETADQYTMAIVITDGGNGGRTQGLSDSATIVVDVTDVNEHPSLGDLSLSVNENSNVNTLVGGVLEGTDPDEGDTELLTYALHADDAGIVPFTVSIVNGYWYVALSGPVDFEAVPEYTFTLVVSDPDGLTDEATVTVAIGDVNEAPALNQTRTYSAYENVAVGFELGTVVATDPDTVPEFNTLRYYISQPDDFPQFGLDAVSGLFTVVQELDYETQRDYYVPVTVYDGTATYSLDNEFTYHVAVLDVNDLKVFSVSDANGNQGDDIRFGTGGGELVVFTGSNLGPSADSVADLPDPVITVTFMAYFDAAVVEHNVYTAEDCEITIHNTEVTCTMPPGVGHSFFWNVTINDGWDTVDAGQFMVPVIETVSGASDTPTGGGAADDVTLTGTNFGPVGHTFSAVYGYGYNARNCRVTANDGPFNVTAVCSSAEGVGINLDWTLTTASLGSNTVVGSFGYGVPVVDSVLVEASGSPLLDTRGSQTIRVLGSNFGPFETASTPDYLLTYSSLYAATGCFVFTKHVELRCVSQAGIGKDHEVIVTIAGQNNPVPRATTAYQPPVAYTPFAGSGASGANTGGGQLVLISGDMFGPKGTAAPDVSAVYGGSQFSSNLVAAGCSVTTAHVQISCYTVAGTGDGLWWDVTVGAQATGQVAANTSYALPLVMDIYGVGAIDAYTGGGETVFIEGRNFGLASVSPISLISYGETGETYDTTASCLVTEDHVLIRCDSVEGAGRDHSWTVVIDRQFSIAPSTSYGVPEVHSIQGVGAIDADTAGGQQVILGGLNFGPPAEEHLLDRVTYGITGVEYAAANCTVESHLEIHCLTVAGVGQNLVWVVVVAGQASDVSESATSYAKPTVELLTPTHFGTNPSGAYYGSDQFITIEGRHFGLHDALASGTKLYFGGELVDSWGSQRNSFTGTEYITMDLPEGYWRHANGNESVVITVSSGDSLRSSDDSEVFSYDRPTITDIAARQPPAEYQAFMDLDTRVTYMFLEVRGSNFGMDPDNQPFSFLKSYVTINGGTPVFYESSYYVTFGHEYIECLADTTGYSENELHVCVGTVCSDVAYFYDYDPSIVSWGEPGEYAPDGGYKGGRNVLDCGEECDYYTLNDVVNGVGPTEGGGTLKFLAKYVGTFPLPTVTVAGFDCPNVVVAQATEEGVSFGDESTYDEAKLRLISCDFPAGVGAQAEVILTRNDNRASNVVYAQYLAPTVIAFTPETGGVVFSRTLGGNEITITGLNFGVPDSGQAVYIESPDGSRTTGTVRSQDSHRTLVVALPEGEGADKLLVIDVVGHEITVPMSYSPPEFDEIRFRATVHDPADGLATGPSTEGGSSMIIAGDNFGRIGLYGEHSANISDGRGGTWPCDVFGAIHTQLHCTIPEGQGQYLTVTVNIAGLVSTFAEVLSYKPPRVDSMTPVHTSTAGGSQVIVVGSNFGLWNYGHVLFHGVASYLVPDEDDTDSERRLEEAFAIENLVSYNHTHIVGVMPAGQGVNKSLIVQAGAGDSMQESIAVLYSYDPPRILEEIEYLTDDVSTDGGFDIIIRGENFGTSKAALDVKVSRYNVWDLYNLPTQCNFFEKCNGLCCQSCKVVSFGHDEIRCTVASGIGAHLPVMVTVADLSEPDRIPIHTEEEVYFSYDPPSLDDQQLIQSVYYAHGHVNLVLSGKNFGASLGVVTVDGYGNPIPLSITLGNKTCENPTWSDTDVQVGAGVPHLRCPTTPVDTVGWKNVTVEVAGQTLFREDMLWAKCKETYYGQYGELCLPCSDVDNNAGAVMRGAECLAVLNTNQDPEYEFEDGSTTVFLKVLPCEGEHADDDGNCASRYPFTDSWAWVDGETAVSSDYTEWSNATGTPQYEVEYIYVEPFARYGWWGFQLPTPDDRCEEERLHRSACLYFAACRPEEACIGNNYCDTPYTGERCTECADGYFRLDGVCEECPDCGWCIPVMFAMAAISCTTVAYYLKKKNVNVGILSIGVDYFQVLALFARAGVAWPNSLNKLFTYLSAFNINLNLTAPECLSAFAEVSYSQKWGFIESLPLGIAALFMVSHWLTYLYKRCILRHTSGLHGHLHSTISIAFMATYYLYLFVSKTTLEIFNCSPVVPTDGYEYMEADFIRCYTGVHAQLLPWAVICFFVYTVGYPTVVSLVLFRNSKKCEEDQLLRAKGTGDTAKSNPNCYDFRLRYHVLYYHFKPSCYYWILIVLWRKFMIVMTSLMFKSNVTFQLCLSLLVMFLAYAMQVKNNPYMSMSERESVVAEHEAKLEEENAFLHSTLRKAENLRRAKGNIKLGDAWGNKDFKMAGQAAASFFWNYNTVESVLLFCAVMVNLSGIMFESGQFATVEESTWDREVLTYLVIMIVSFSIIYFFAVLMSELSVALCPGSLPAYMTNQDERKEDEEEEEEEEEIDEKEFEFAIALPTTTSERTAAEQNEVIAAQQAEIARLKKEEQMLSLKAFNTAPAGKGKKKKAKKYVDEGVRTGLMGNAGVVDSSSWAAQLPSPGGVGGPGVEAFEMAPMAPMVAPPPAGQQHVVNPGGSSPWYPVVDPNSGRMYYVNSVTGETSWTAPPGM